jgi:hypothetical protein
MQVILFVTEDHDDWSITSAASEICDESDICPRTKATAECSSYVRSLTRGVGRCYQVSGDKY